MGEKLQSHGEETAGGSERVLFLKKVHSWEGVTEMVLGLFLLFL